MKKLSTKKLVALAVLTAIEIVLSKFCTVQIGTMKFGFAGIALAVAAMTFGPVAGGCVGGIADFLGSIMFPTGGAYLPGFTLSAAIAGVIFGLILYKKDITLLRVILAVIAVILIRTVLLNTLLQTLYFGYGFFAMLPGRLLQAISTLVIQTIFIMLISKQKLIKFEN